MKSETFSLAYPAPHPKLSDHSHFYFGALWPVPVGMIPFKS